MAFDTYTAERIDGALRRKSIPFEEKHMFGGVAFMVDHKMCIGVIGNELMCRVGPHRESEALAEQGAGPMLFTGRALKGYITVKPEGFDTEADLEKWVDWCLVFNPEAKASRKK